MPFRKAKRPTGVMTSHHKRGKLEAGRFENFDKYVASEGHGLSVAEANEKARLDAVFLRQIQEWQSAGVEPKGMKSREENISNLIWFMTKKSFEYGTPMDAGTYTLGLETPEQTAFLNDYLKGKPGLGVVSRFLAGLSVNALTGILNIIPGIWNLITPRSWPKSAYFPPVSKIFGLGTNPERAAYRRASSHFKKRVKEGHFGYDVLNDEVILPGKYKTIVFGLMKDGRIYIKPEEHGMDPIHQPGEALLHSLGFVGSRKHRDSASEGRDPNDKGQAGVQLARKEYSVEDIRMINKYKELLGKKRILLVKEIMKNLGEDKSFKLLLGEKFTKEEAEKLKKNPEQYEAVLLSKMAELENKKNLSSIEKEIIKNPKYKSYIRLSKMSAKPKGDLDKMRADILKEDGVSTLKERRDMVIEFNKEYIRMNEKRFANDDFSVQYGDENAFSFKKETLQRDSGEAEPLSERIRAVAGNSEKMRAGTLSPDFFKTTYHNRSKLPKLTKFGPKRTKKRHGSKAKKGKRYP